MELSPQSVANTSFKTVKKGYDPAEVRSYLDTLSKSIEGLQSQATAMEARARAAVARLQEIAAQPVAQPATEAMPATSAEPVAERSSLVELHADEAATISRTLLLAQRTADTTVAEAEAEAKRITDAATDESCTVVNEAQDTASRLIDEAKADARRAGEAQRIDIESEVQSLLARREFLISDVDHLELHIITQRDRLRDVATSLNDIVAKVPGGLGDVRRPLVSAVGDDESRTDHVANSAVSEPVFDALESSSAMSELGDAAADEQSSTDFDDEATPESNPEESNPEESNPEESGAAPDGTPPSGQTNQFLFEDITSEVQAVVQAGTPDRPANDLTVDGDELR